MSYTVLNIATESSTIGQTTNQLQELNAREVRLLTPLLVYLFFICIAGIIGNGLSLYVYSFNFTQSNSRCFLIFLSMLELISCTVIVPCEISMVFRQLTFTSDVECKLYVFINISQVSAGSVILVVIAVDRWRKICHPFQWQMSLRHSKCLCACTVGFGFIAALPSTFVYGVRYFTPHGANITASECSINNTMAATLYPLIYNGLFWVLVLIGISCLSVLYFRIVRVVKRREEMHALKFATKRKPRHSVLLNKLQTDFKESIDSEDRCERYPLNDQVAGTSLQRDVNTYIDGENKMYTADSLGSLENMCDAIEEATEDTLLDEEKQTTEEHAQTTTSNTTPVKRAFHTEKAGTKTNEKTSQRMPGKDQTNQSNRSRNVTLIMFVITISSLVCFIPYLVLGLQRAIYENFTETRSESTRILYKCLIRSYLLKAVFNPLIYGSCDKRFRQVVGNMFKKFKQML